MMLRVARIRAPHGAAGVGLVILLALRLTFAVGTCVSVAGLAHCDYIPEGVWTTRAAPVHLPLAPQNSVASSFVVGAGPHGAFATSASTLPYFIAECHVSSPFINPIALHLQFYLSYVSNMFAEASLVRIRHFHCPLVFLCCGPHAEDKETFLIQLTIREDSNFILYQR